MIIRCLILSPTVDFSHQNSALYIALGHFGASFHTVIDLQYYV